MAAREIDPIVIGIARTVLGGLVAVPLALMLRIPLPKRELPHLRHLRLLRLHRLSDHVQHRPAHDLRHAWRADPGCAADIHRPGRRRGRGAAATRYAGGWAAVIAFAGEVVLVTSRTRRTGRNISLTGDLLILLASVMAASGYVAGARLTQARYASMGATLWGIASASPSVLPVYPIANDG